MRTTSSSRRVRSPVRGLAFLLLLPLAACGDGGAPPAEPVPGRPDDDLLRSAALQEVVDLQVARDGQTLAARLSSPDPLVRARAAFALGSVRDPGARDALGEALKDPSPVVRRDAAWALGQMEEGDGTPDVLQEALAVEGEAEVRASLIESIGRVGNRDAVDGLASFRDPRNEAVIALALSRAILRGVLSREAVERVVGGMTHPDPEVRLHSSYLFGRLENPVLWAAHRDRVRAALAAYDAADPAAAHLLRGLVATRAPAAEPVYEAWYRRSSDWRIRQRAMEGLVAALVDPGAIPFRSRLGPGSGRLERKEIVAVVVDGATGDPSPHVRATAAPALVDAPLAAGEVERLERWVRRHPDELGTVGPLLASLGRNGRGDTVVEWLGDVPLSDTERWRIGLRALAGVSGQEAARLVARALGAPDTTVVNAAVRDLVPRWGRAREADEDVAFHRDLLFDAVGSGDPVVVGRLAPLLSDPALVAAGSVEVLEEAWRALDPARDRRAAAALLDALGRSGSPQAVPVLEEALQHEDPVGLWAARALGILRGERAPVVRLEGRGSGDAGASDGSAEPTRPGDRRAEDVEVPTRVPSWLGQRVVWEDLVRLGPHPHLRLETERGTVVVRLDADEAPMTVQAVATLAAEGLYDDTPFHRVVPDFVIQGGDVARGGGEGEAGFSLRTESTRIRFRRGVIGMASAGRDTEGSQFFITHSVQPHLDGEYTAFGHVVEGIEVVDRIQRGDRIVRARIEGGR